MKLQNAPHPAVKKPIALLLLIFLMIGLFTPVAAETSTDTTPDNIAATDTAGEPLKLTWLLAGETPEDFDRVTLKVNEYLESKDRVTVEFIFRSKSSYSDYKNILIASGMPVDLMFTSDWVNYAQDVQKGSFLALNNLIDAYAPKTKTYLGKIPLKGAEVNGKIYAVPTPGRPLASANGILFRKDLVGKLNINLSKVKSINDLEPILKTVKSKQPALIPMLQDPIFPSYSILGMEIPGNDYWVPGVISTTGKDNKIFNEFTRPEMMSYFKTLNKYYKLGYLKSSMAADKDIITGKVFSIFQSELSPGTPLPVSNYEWTPVYLNKQTLHSSTVQDAMNAVPATSKHPQEAIRLLERINTDAYLTNLFHFGVEGEHYIKNSNGTISYPAGVDSSNTTYSPLFKEYLPGNSYLDYLWKNEDPNKNKNLKSFNDAAVMAKSFGFSFDSAAVSKEQLACQDICLKYVPKLLLGEYDPEKYLTTFNTDLKKAGVDKLISAKQQQYNTWLASSTGTGTGTAATGITVKLYGSALTLSAPAVTDAGVLLVPMKSFLDALDSIYEYNSTTKTLTARSGKNSLKLLAGSKTATVNGKEAKLAAAPKIIDNQLYIPAEFVCNTFGFTYQWNSSGKAATIAGRKEAESRGNSSGNLANGGYIAEKGDWLYIALDDNGLYKIKKDGSSKIKISDKSAAYLNITNEYIYYVNGSYTSESESMRLYRIKPDGSSKIKLSPDKVSSVNLVGEWIYYINTTDGNKPYRMSLDGKTVKKLSDSALSNLSVSSGWIYYHLRYGKELYRMRTSGADILKLAADAGTSFPVIDNTGEWIYYSPGTLSTGIYKIKNDGTGNTLVALASPLSLQIGGDWLYYWDSTGSIYKINEKEHSKVRVASGSGYNLGLSGDWLYYINYSYPDVSDINFDDYEDLEDLDSLFTYSYYRIKTDGSVKQKFDDKATVSNVYTKQPGQTAFESKPVSIPSSSPQSALKTAKEIAKSRSAVAHVKVYNEEGKVKSTGSGFVITPNGVVVTNYHVVQDAASIECEFENGKTYKVDYALNYNGKKDIAVLQLKDAAGLPVVTLGDSDRVELADDVLAIGNPMDFQNTLSTGIISGIRKIIGMHYLQTTAAISPGSSGGPLFNMYGDVIGITSMYIGNSQNLNFAVPINQVKQLFASSRVIPISMIGDYEDTVYEFEKNDSLATADDITPDQNLCGTLSDEKDADYFKFNLAGSGTVDVYGALNDTVGAVKKSGLLVKLLDAGGNILSEGKEVTEENMNLVKVSMYLNAGTYYLSVQPDSTKSFSSKKDYSITTQVN